ncbi:MAG: TIGR00730 family Rossman fold protein [Spirochaetae bacterium HGW-Spirochaetae-1]|jgi:hypothetical protein|nr:MAG: TIGR00730 family Rossman fold protein [Spirochaetae bacterium HGW-Spirochaetae-1]
MNAKKTILAFDNPEFLRSREARAIRILSEYLEPEKRFQEKNILHTVVFFGSARFTPENKYYIAAEELAYEMVLMGRELEEKIGNGFYICTGGGPGIMEAANRGAHRAGEKTIGLNIELPNEQGCNPFITPELNFEFNYFFMRKFWFLYHAKAIIVFPGGFGTLDELFESLTLVQTKKIEKFDLPILLYDRDYWNDLINFPKLVEMELISPEDMKLIHFFSTPAEAINILKPRMINLMEYIEIYHEV